MLLLYLWLMYYLLDAHYAHFSGNYIHSWDHAWYLHIGHLIEENQEGVTIFLKKQTCLKNEICCITSKGKTAKDEQKTDSNFLPALYIVYKKLGQFFFHTLLTNLFQQRYISSVTSYKYLNKSTREV